MKRFDLDTYVDIFLNIEEKYVLHDKEIDGIFYWRYYRMHLFTKLENHLFNLDIAHKKNHGVKGAIKKYIEPLYFGYIKNNKIKKSDYLIFNSPRRFLVNTKYKCIYTSDLIKELDNPFVYERFFQHKTPVCEEKVYYGDKIEINANLFSVVNLKKKVA